MSPGGASGSGRVSTAVLRARRGQSRWRSVPLCGRLRILRNFRGALATRADEFAAAVDRHLNRRPGETLAAELIPLAEACRFLERRAPRILKPRRERDGLPLPFGRLTIEVRREPHGVVLVIGPSNYPLFLPGVQVVQALAAGNAVVLKPGAGGVHVARMLAECLEAAGLDADLLTVTSESVEDAQRAIEAGVDKVLLTGSAQTGRAVLRRLAAELIPAAVELSGCDAVFVLEDADPELVARALAFGVRLNCGGTCVAPRRVFVPASLAPQIEPRLVRAVRRCPPCAVAPEKAAFASGLIEQALAAGARRVTGRMRGNGESDPVVLAGARAHMGVMREDIFAPVLSIMEVHSVEEALDADDACPYALGAAIFGGEDAARQLAARVRAGVVVVNDMIVPTADPRVPFGGRDRSGYGVTRGAEGLLEVTRLKTIVVSRSRRRPHLELSFQETEALLRDYLRVAHGRGWAARVRAGLRLLGAGVQWAFRGRRSAQKGEQG